MSHIHWYKNGSLYCEICSHFQLDNDKPVEVYKWRKCVSQVSSACRKQVKGYSTDRCCEVCKDLIRDIEKNYNSQQTRAAIGEVSYPNMVKFYNRKVD